MKYLLTEWKNSQKSHQLAVENKTPSKTTHIKGYGFGVTFSTRCVSWHHDFTSHPTAESLNFSASSVSK